MGRSSGRSRHHELAELRELLDRIARVNPTGQGRPAREERARYAEKARLQSELIERFPGEVRVQARGAAQGVVGLAVPRLHALAAHAVVEALSDRARAWVEDQIRAAREVEPAAPGPSAPQIRGPSRIERAAALLADYDFECAEAQLTTLASDASAPAEERARALALLLELYVDHLARDGDALALEGSLRALGPLSDRARELLGVAATRAGDVDAALSHLRWCSAERAAPPLAALARRCADARAWGQAAEAWERLRACATAAEPPFAAEVIAQRDDARRHIDQIVAEVGGEEISADDALARLVREVAHDHPWLRARRGAMRRARTRAAARALLERAERCLREADLPGLEEALAAIARHEPASADGAARVHELTAQAEQLRITTQAARVLAMATTSDAEAACAAYAASSERVREQVRASGVTPVFKVLDALSTMSPDRAPTRPLIRAAAAWKTAEGLDDGPARWALVEPHAHLLETVTELATEVRRLRALARDDQAKAVLPVTRAPTSSREVRIEELRFIDVAEPPDGAEGPIEVGSFAVCIGGVSHVVTLGARGDATHLTLCPLESRASRRCLRVEGPLKLRPGGLLTTRHRVGLLTESRALWLLGFTPDLSVRRLDLSAHDPHGDREITMIDDNLIGLRAPTGGTPGSAWRLIDMKDGRLRGELEGPGIHMSRTPLGSVFHRVTEAYVESLHAAGQTFGRFDLPWGVSPFAVIESPLTECPLLLSALSEHSGTMLWWQPEGRFFRAFELFDTMAHGAPIDAVTLGGQGVFIVTRRSDGAMFLHAVQVGKGALRPAPRPVAVPEHLRLVADARGPRGWMVQRSREAGVSLRPLRLQDVAA